MQTSAITLISISLSALLVILIYLRLKRHYSYWERKKIPFTNPIPILGNLSILISMRTSFGDFFKLIYNSPTAKDAPIVGMYLLHKPALLIRDPELIRTIFIKNFEYFLNRYEAADPIHDSMGYLTLPLAKYPIWRETRKRMAEFFTSGKLKHRMYPLMLKVSLELEQCIEDEFLKQIDAETITDGVIIEVRELCARYTVDLTALLSYSIRAESLKGNLKHRKALMEMLRPTFFKTLNFFILFFLPNLARHLRAKVFPATYVKFIRKMLETNLKQREDANEQENYKDDLIDLLLNFQRHLKFEQMHKFAQHPDFITSQAAIMLIAGFETSSSLIAFILFELAKQPEIQRKLRSEIKTYFKSNEQNDTFIKYDDLLGMTYLNMVVAEGLRMYPTASFINREFTPESDMKSFSLRPFIDYDLTDGIPVYVSILGIHRDERFWPNPQTFDPDRFQEERAKLIFPMTYIPFGVGPHSCIGSRLGTLQVKLGLVYILRNYIVECCSTTPEKIIFEPKSFMLQNKGGIELKFFYESNSNKHS